MQNTTTINVRITGIRPLIMHNARYLCDPLSDASKEMKKVSGKQKKTEEDHMEMARIEWRAGLYTAGDHVVIPGDNILRAIRDGGARMKLGKAMLEVILPIDDAQLVTGGRKLTLAECEREYDKFAFRSSVAVQRNRVMRTRPRFDDWAAEFTVDYINAAKVETAHIITAIESAGLFVGLGDWRPKYGRFSVEVL